MVRGIINFITKFLIFIIFVLIMTAGWVIYDGLADTFDTADCAVVPGHSLRPDGQPGSVLRARLDRAIELFNSQKVPAILVTGGDTSDRKAEADAMARYLKDHGVTSQVILKDAGGTDADNTLHHVAEILDEHHLKSAMLVTHYYDMTLCKMELARAGVSKISQAHVGQVRKEDILNIANDVFAIYQQLFKHYLGPATAQAGDAARVEAERLTAQLHSETQKAEDDGKKAAKPSEDKGK